MKIGIFTYVYVILNASTQSNKTLGISPAQQFMTACHVHIQLYIFIDIQLVEAALGEI